QTIEGIKEMNSMARQNVAVVNLEFEADFDKDKALADVRAKVDMARGRFPPDSEEPIVEEANASGEPIIGIVLSRSSSRRAATSRRKPSRPSCARSRAASAT